jgi:serine protease AprX
MRARLLARLLPISVGALLLLTGLIVPGSLPLRASPPESAKLGPSARQRAALSSGRSTVILQVRNLAAARSAVLAAKGTLGRTLPSISSQVATLPNAALAGLSSSASILNIALDRDLSAATERTGATIGATAVRQQLGYDGAGIGIAVIDSGVDADHDDLTDPAGSRIDRFVDFVDGRTTAYDDYGHGTHVAGIIAGNGFDSSGRRTGIAPAARLTVLKALDAAGNGHISDVIAAIEYAVANRDELNIRIINLSVASGVYESYETDPLTRAALYAVRSGMVVVGAAGNNGISPQGFTRYGGITAPGNAPWVLTVGGSSHMGTIDRGDDTIALFSSRGPTAIDAAAKPDVVAPGVGIESLAAPGSRLYTSLTPYLLDGTVTTTDKPYLSMSGTSMAAPVVAGTVALMLQANPALTPNQVKAILQYTAEVDSHSDPLTQGAGFLNARGAVELARFLATSDGAYPDASRWSRRLLWGNYLFKNGRLSADASAWPADVTWGSAAAPDGAPIEWGVICSDATCSTTNGRWTLSSAHRNVVWGNACGGDSCASPWSLAVVTSAIADSDTVVWGTLDDSDTVVWGTIDQGETVVWGTSDFGETVVWGTSCSGPACIPAIWR